MIFGVIYYRPDWRDEPNIADADCRIARVLWYAPGLFPAAKDDALGKKFFHKIPVFI